jgi:hypothetical protein
VRVTGRGAEDVSMTFTSLVMWRGMLALMLRSPKMFSLGPVTSASSYAFCCPRKGGMLPAAIISSATGWSGAFITMSRSESLVNDEPLSKYTPAPTGWSITRWFTFRTGPGSSKWPVPAM